MLSYLLATIIAYFLGSFPTGYLVAKLHKNVDLLHQGSGKTGATNVLRALGWRAAGLVFAGDLAKGMLAIILARLLSDGDPIADMLAGLAVLAGHNYSLFLGFRGGRGVTTGVGTLFVMVPPAGAISITTFAVVTALTKYASLGSIIGALTVPPVVLGMFLFMHDPAPHLVYVLIGVAFIIASHGENIRRLATGTERKIR